MHFLYVDESGDTGIKAGASTHFVLCGVLIHHADWQVVSEDAKGMRRRLAEQFGLPEEAELHASELLSKNSNQFRLSLAVRIRCALHAIGFMSQHQGIQVLRVVVTKEVTQNNQIYANAWKELIVAGLALVAGTGRGCNASGLIVICDDHRTAPRHELISAILTEHPGAIIDLPFGLDSKDSILLQLADLSAYLTKQSLSPSGTFKGRNGRPLLQRNAELQRNVK